MKKGAFKKFVNMGQRMEDILTVTTYVDDVRPSPWQSICEVSNYVLGTPNGNKERPNLVRSEGCGPRRRRGAI